MAYELKTNTVVDALNEIYATLAGDEAGKEADTVLEALNNISVALGGSVYTSTPDAVRAVGANLSSGGGSETSGYTLVPVTFVDETAYGFIMGIPLVTIEDSEDGQVVISQSSYESDLDNDLSWFLLVPDGEYVIKIVRGDLSLVVNGATYNSGTGALTDISSEGVTITVHDGGMQ